MKNNETAKENEEKVISFCNNGNCVRLQQSDGKDKTKTFHFLLTFPQFNYIVCENIHIFACENIRNEKFRIT